MALTIRHWRLHIGSSQAKSKSPRNEIQGAVATKYKAFPLSHGTYIQYLDLDDLMAPDKIGGQKEASGPSPDKWTLHRRGQRQISQLLRLAACDSFGCHAPRHAGLVESSPRRRSATATAGIRRAPESEHLKENGDGVINRRRPDDYVLDGAQFIFLAGMRVALKQLATLGLPMIVISNQAAMGKGLLGSARLEEITTRMQQALLSDGTPLAAA